MRKGMASIPVIALALLVAAPASASAVARPFDNVCGRITVVGQDYQGGLFGVQDGGKITVINNVCNLPVRVRVGCIYYQHTASDAHIMYGGTLKGNGTSTALCDITFVTGYYYGYQVQELPGIWTTHMS